MVGIDNALVHTDGFSRIVERDIERVFCPLRRRVWRGSRRPRWGGWDINCFGRRGICRHFRDGSRLCGNWRGSPAGSQNEGKEEQWERVDDLSHCGILTLKSRICAKRIYLTSVVLIDCLLTILSPTQMGLVG